MISEGFIQPEDLEIGKVYKLNSRNLALGVYRGDSSFIGIREKFGNRFLDEEVEWDADKHYGTARAVGVLGFIHSIPLQVTLGTKCDKCGQPINFDVQRPEKDRWRHTANDTPQCEKAWAVSVGNPELFAKLEEFENNYKSKKEKEKSEEKS
jgi:hypothetical protein